MSLQRYTVPVLRAVLQSHSQRTDGNKEQLIDRLNDLSGELNIMQELEEAQATVRPQKRRKETALSESPPTSCCSSPSPTASSSPSPTASRSSASQVASPSSPPPNVSTCSINASGSAQLIRDLDKDELPPDTFDPKGLDSGGWYYMRYVRYAFMKYRHETLSFRPISGAELGWTPCEWAACVQGTAEKSMKFICDSKGRRWVLKFSCDISESRSEYEINYILRQLRLHCVMPALLWCKAKVEDDSPVSGMMIIPFINASHTCSHYISNPEDLPGLFERTVGAVDLIRALQQLPSFPEHNEEIRVKIGDMHLGQIMLTTSGHFKIIDFEVAEVQIRQRYSKQTISTATGDLPLQDISCVLPLVAEVFSDDPTISRILKEKSALSLKERRLRSELRHLSKKSKRPILPDTVFPTCTLSSFLRHIEVPMDRYETDVDEEGVEDRHKPRWQKVRDNRHKKQLEGWLDKIAKRKENAC